MNFCICILSYIFSMELKQFMMLKYCLYDDMGFFIQFYIFSIFWKILFFIILQIENSMMTFRKKQKHAMDILGQELNQTKASQSKTCSIRNNYTKNAAVYNLQSTLGYITRRVLNVSFRKILDCIITQSLSQQCNKQYNSGIYTTFNKSFSIQNTQISQRLNSTIQKLKSKIRATSCEYSENSLTDRKIYSAYNSKEKLVRGSGNKQTVLKNILKKLEQKRQKDSEDSSFSLNQRVIKLEQTVKKMKQQHSHLTTTKFLSKNRNYSNKYNLNVPTSNLDQYQQSPIQIDSHQNNLQKAKSKSIFRQKQNYQICINGTLRQNRQNRIKFGYPTHRKQIKGHEQSKIQEKRQQKRTLINDLRSFYNQTAHNSKSYQNNKQQVTPFMIGTQPKVALSYYTPRATGNNQQFELSYPTKSPICGCTCPYKKN